MYGRYTIVYMLILYGALAYMTYSEYSPVDLAFARFLRENERSANAAVIGKAGLLLSAASRSGHTRLSLNEITGNDDKSRHDSLHHALGQSTQVSDGSTPAAIVHDGAGNLWLYKYWRAEKDLAKLIIERSRQHHDSATVSDITGYFPDSEEVNYQAMAVAMALRNNLTIITGGPGTGKTTTAATICKLILKHEPDKKISLIAPTGKATARLEESIKSQGVELSAQTIHSFLGWRGNSFIYNNTNQTPCECVIVDEASMVDILLMKALFEALRADCKVILLGDENQLASVEAGCVLSDICSNTGGFSEKFIEYYLRSGLPAPQACTGGILSDNVVQLEKNWRFAQQPGISSLASAIQNGSPLDEIFSTHNDIACTELEQQILTEWITQTREQIMSANSPQAALEILRQRRIICALRRGPSGVSNANQIARTLVNSSSNKFSAEFYHGLPIIVERNDYQLKLYNGDSGICWKNESGEMMVHFENGLSISPARLPQFNEAWAITVHKSQGSEFDEVLLIMPEKNNPLCCRELAYTGVTRCKRKLLILDQDGSLEYAVKIQLKRKSGLKENLETL